MVVHQSTERAVMNWQSFSIGRDARVHFDQQAGVSSVTLNRVVGGNPSNIMGAMTAPGKVFLINPSGIVFGQGSNVSVGGLVASTMEIDNEKFMAGIYRFTRGCSTASVVNRGKITAADGGLVALLGSDMENDGVIATRFGSVLLASGEAMTLSQGDGLWSVSVDPSTVAGLVRNGKIIRADGGTVVMRASTAEGLVGSVVNTGEVRARTIGGRNGRLVLIGDMESGTAGIAGTLDASAPDGGDGGFIETSAASVRIAKGTVVTTKAPYGETGVWLIDPTNFTISAGTASWTGSGIGASTLQNALELTDVTIATSATGSEAGEINVNAPVSWSANTLSLQAHGEININAVMTASGSSKLDLKAGYSTPGSAGGTYDPAKTVKCNLSADGFTGRVDFPGRSGTGFLTINGEAYTVIKDLGAAGSRTGTDLQGMNGNLTGKYALGSDIDASSTSGWNAGKGWQPVGLFRGRFDGLGHIITGLYSNHISDKLSFTGLFGSIHDRWDADAGYVLRNIGMERANINGSFVTGSLAGAVFSSSVTNVYATGSVHATDRYTGGLFGTIEAVKLGNSFNAANVTSTVDYVGGITGLSTCGHIDNVYNTGNVTGTVIIGGICGGLNEFNSGIRNSYNTGTVTGTDQVGGLVGLGGYKVWYELSGLTVANASGGLIGLQNHTRTGKIVAHSTDIGKTVTIQTIITGCVWDKTTSGKSTSAGGAGVTGLTSDQMTSGASFGGWDFSNTWRIYEGQSRPVLRSFQRSLSVTASDQTITYDSMSHSGGNGVVYSISGATPAGDLAYTGDSQGAQFPVYFCQSFVNRQNPRHESNPPEPETQGRAHRLGRRHLPGADHRRQA